MTRGGGGVEGYDCRREEGPVAVCMTVWQA